MKKSRVLTFGMIIALLFLAGCSNNGNGSEKDETAVEDTETGEKSAEESTNFIEFGKDDEEIKTALEAEEGVEKVEMDSNKEGTALFLDVYVASEDFASGEALVKKYTSQLQALHPDAKIDVVFAHGTNTIVYETVIDPAE